MPVPAELLIWDVDLPRNPSRPFPEDFLNRAVDDCLGSLSGALLSGQRVCILVDDYSRSTPTPAVLKKLLPGLLRAGIREKDLFFIFASGSHRLMTQDEKKARLGAEAAARFQSLDHRFFDGRELRLLGRFEDGAPILINRHVMEADVRIAIGTLVPHMPAGYSGGAKMLLPGVAGEATVHHMHLIGALDPNQAVGMTDTLPRRLMEAMAARVSPFSIINAILDADSRPVAFVGGRYDEAFRRGVGIARPVYTVAIPGPADLVVADTRGHDADMTQAHKGLFSAALAVKPGGEILLLSDCPEGVSPAHGEEMLAFGLYGNDDVAEAVRGGRMKDPLAAIEILHANIVRSRARTCLACSNITAAQAAQMNLTPVTDVAAFVRNRRAEGRTVGRLRNATYIIPEIRA